MLLIMQSISLLIYDEYVKKTQHFMVVLDGQITVKRHLLKLKIRRKNIAFHPHSYLKLPSESDKTLNCPKKLYTKV